MSRQFAVNFAVAILLVACSLPSVAATNLVVIVADDLGWGDVGYHGSEIRTPSIDRLAAEGVALQRFYAHPVCSPTRGALLTGRSPLTTGVLMPFEPWFSSGLPTEEKLLPEYLKDVGYQTLMAGKWHLGPNQLRYHPLRRGFDHYYGHLGGFINYDLHTIWRGIDWQRNGETVFEEGYATHLITAEAVRLIKERDKDAPMFLYVTFNAPHSPLQAPDSAVAGYADIDDINRRVYAAMVSEMDRGIGQVLTTLDDEGIGDETLVFFMSDNGGSERLGADNGQLRGGKAQLSEGGIRVPAVLRWPDHIDAGSEHGEIFTVEDVLPTLVSALGVSPQWANSLDGSDQWLAIAAGREVEEEVRVLTRHDGKQYLFALFHDHWKLVRAPIVRGGEMQTQLFDINTDPFEKNDVASDNPDIVQQLLAAFEAIPKAEIVGLDDPPIPTLTGLGGPASIEPDSRPPNRQPYAESALEN